ncbi:hypothetical protein FQN50_009134 [Emmonsiellopsis sp. PD_5]|nr:hypothetical protein FQN50_009134 [Emmonsiellopsis sp. PD_5]
MVAPGDELKEALSSVLNTGLYSDLEILSQGRSFKEAATRWINLDDDHPLIIEKAVDYLYKLDYSDDDYHTEPLLPEVEEQLLSRDPYTLFSDLSDEGVLEISSKNKSGTLPLLFNAQIYAFGEKYGIPGLKELAKEKFEAAIENVDSNPIICSVVSLVYKSTYDGDHGLWDVMLRIAHQNAATLGLQPEFQRTLEALPSFTLDLACKFIKNMAHLPGSERVPAFGVPRPFGR